MLVVLVQESQVAGYRIAQRRFRSLSVKVIDGKHFGLLSGRCW